MKIIRDIAELRAETAGLGPLALVPTMGNLHEGHLSLVRIAQRQAPVVAVSIFVNRLQFQPSEDFDRYPRTLLRDCELLEAQGVRLVFAPDEPVLYPEQQTVTIDPGSLGEELEGRYRPGFFKGVATIVLKLFNCVQPAVSVFGKKDYQQLLVIRQMVRQLNLPLEIVSGDIVRESDGLAMSSRNAYLTPSERREAPRLFRVLSDIAAGRRSSMDATRELTDAGWKTDYIEVRRRKDLGPPGPEDEDLVVLGAARLGATRLIDNLEF